MARSIPASFVTAAVLPDESEKDSLDRELDLIRARREGDKRFFRGAFEDYTLVAGLIIGTIFFGGVFVMSSGWIAADSIVVDKTLSSTPLDPGEECVDREGQVWFNIFFSADDHLLKADSYNVDPDAQTVIGIVFEMSNLSEQIHLKGGLGDQQLSFDPSELEDGYYNTTVLIWKVITDDEIESLDQSELAALDGVNDDPIDYKEVGFEVSSHSSGPFSSDIKQEVEVHDVDPRSCWSIEGLGEWGWIMMGAEWVGGREAAMLTGGNAGIPAWWMAMVSLGMSLFFLCVQYPLMHKMYHRDSDDLLNKDQLRRLIHRTLGKSQKQLRIDIDFEQIKMQQRPISIDILLPYTTFSTTIDQPADIRAQLNRSLLEEFAIFGEMRPLQMKIICVDDGIHEAHEGAPLSFNPVNSPINPMEDYSAFFAEMSAYGWLEAAAQTSLNRWFKKHNLVDYGTAVLADEDAVFVRVIYQPVIRFSYFFFKPTFTDLQNDLHAHLKIALEPHLGGRVLVVSARNEKATLSDQAMAGRVEQPDLGDGIVRSRFKGILPESDEEELVGEALVAKQGGITGALLQNPFMGDILSSVEYVAHKNQTRIEKYGFWFLIVFVWIPFMASGVLVGAMLGLVARMRFQRVLAACLFGGTAASLTWAYTARGIIEFMERYHAEAFIPFVILLAVAFTIMHVRKNKRKRREELFRSSMAFFAGAAD